MGLVLLSGASGREQTEAWAKDELRDAALGDKRRGARLVRLVAALSLRPASSVPDACGSWGATKGAYALWSNPAVSPEAILAPHAERTCERAAGEEVVLAIQDTTSLDFTSHPATKGLGPLENEHLLGILMHSVLLATTEGVPLGLVHQEFWTRDPQSVGKRDQRRQKETRDKESRKWLTGLQVTMERVNGKRVVTVADAEGDLYDHLAWPRQEGTELLIRAAQDRCVSDEARLLWAAMESVRPHGRWPVRVSRKEDLPGRTAIVSVRWRRVEIEPPVHRKDRRRLRVVPLNAVLVREEEPPEGVEPLEWLLLTSLKVETLEEARQCAEWYSHRWLIERYHYVLKSGCRVEDLQLETAERLERAVATYDLVAWRLLWLTYQARRQPEAPCTLALEREEWETLYCVTHKTSQPPRTPPSLRDAVRWIAQLGGFLGRKGDGEPGPKTLWRGYRRLTDVISGARLANAGHASVYYPIE